MTMVWNGVRRVLCAGQAKWNKTTKNTAFKV